MEILTFAKLASAAKKRVVTHAIRTQSLFTFLSNKAPAAQFMVSETNKQNCSPCQCAEYQRETNKKAIQLEESNFCSTLPIKTHPNRFLINQ